MNFRFLIFIIIPILFSCTSTLENLDNEEVISKKHFKITQLQNHSTIEIVEPFLGSSISEKYVLTSQIDYKPEIDYTHLINIPVKSVAIHSATHLGYLAALNKVETIKAATNLSLYYNSSFLKRIENGQVISIGESTINYEALIASDVDVVFSYVIDAAGMKEVEKLRDLGMKVILISEYMESNPLQKAEWLKVFAQFFDVQTTVLASETFKKIEKDYNLIKDRVSESSYIPSVMIGFPWKGTWYVSGGNSYQAKLIHDANASYIWKGINSSASKPLNLEKVYADALNADFWINPGSKSTYESIKNENPNFEKFKPFKEKKMITNFKRSNSNGANDYWESGVVYPNKILQDLYYIFNNKNIVEDSLFYYQVLK